MREKAKGWRRNQRPVLAGSQFVYRIIHSQQGVTEHLVLFIAAFPGIKGCRRFQTSHIVRYEVQEGSLAVDNVYRGVILREETGVYNQAAA